MGNETFKTIFFSDSDTLGQYFAPDNFQTFKPSSKELLDYARLSGARIGAIINLPAGASHDAAVAAIRAAVLAQETGGDLDTIGGYIAAGDVISSVKAGVSKPDAAIYTSAAKQFGFEPGECLFISENFNEVLGAQKAGMQAQLKPCPVGMEFTPALVSRIGQSPVDSGRQFQALLEHEHLLGERIFDCGTLISAWIAKLLGDWSPNLVVKQWKRPPVVTVPEQLKRAIACYVFLLDNFADQVHLRAEEAMLEVAVASGMPASKGRWVVDQHNQARAYWRGLDLAWTRILEGDDDDRWFALRDFKALSDAFVFLFKAHAIREDYETYTEAGDKFSDADDALVMNLIAHTGPSDITPYVGMVERMENLLSKTP